MEEFETAVGEYPPTQTDRRRHGNTRTANPSRTRRVPHARLRVRRGQDDGLDDYPIYYAYWKEQLADPFAKDYSATVKGNGRAELMKKGANYQAVWMYVLHKLEDTVASTATKTRRTSGTRAGRSTPAPSWSGRLRAPPSRSAVC